MRDIFGVSGGVVVAMIALILQPWTLLWGIVLVISASAFIVSGAHLIYEHWGTWSGKRIAITILGTVVIGGTMAMVLWYRADQITAIDVDRLFAETYKNYQADLGKPKSAAVTTPDNGKGVAQVSYQHGAAFWTHQSQTIFALQDDGIWFSRNDNMALPEWYDKERIRRLFKVPSNYDPPQGGFARWRSEQPQRWKQFGEVVWQCGLD
jgi:hypothetical protein